MRVTHIITALRAEGAQMMLYKLLSRTDRKRFDSAVISLSDEGAMGEKFATLNVPVYTIGMRPSRPTPAGVWRLIRKVRELRPDVIQGWMYHGNLAAQLTGALTGAPVVWNIRGSHYSLRDEKPLTAATIWISAKLSGLPVRIISNSAASARGHEEKLGYPSDKGVLIPNGFDTEAFAPSAEARSSLRAEIGLDENAIIIGLLARYHPVKDHASFLCAASLIAKRYEGVHFVLAGKDIDSSNTELCRIIEEAKLSRRVHLLGERQDINRLAAALDIASLSSLSEGFPNVVGEAMACGIPCVVTNVGDAAFVVANNGRIVPPGDSRAMAEAWRELIEMCDEDRLELGRQARQRVVENFSLGAIARQYEALYEELICDREEKKRLNVRHSWLH